MKRILPMILSCFYGLIKKFLKIKKTFYAIYQPDLKRKKNKYPDYYLQCVEIMFQRYCIEIMYHFFSTSVANRPTDWGHRGS